MLNADQEEYGLPVESRLFSLAAVPMRKNTYILIKAHLIGILGDKLERGESLHLDSLQLVLSGVHLCNHHILVLSKVVSQIFPDRGQLLAMPAPWSIWVRGRGTATGDQCDMQLHLNLALIR